MDIGWQGHPFVSPVSHSQPARAPRSPSPVASMKTKTRRAWRPDLDSVTIVVGFRTFAIRRCNARVQLHLHGGLDAEFLQEQLHFLGLVMRSGEVG